MPRDLTSTEAVTVIRIPHAAIVAELSRAPELWQAIAVEVAARARRNADQMKRFVFDAPLVRMASLLLGLATNDIAGGQPGPLTLSLRHSHERVAEMLGISRQWAHSLVRELTVAGIVEWRYGRVTVRDLPALKALASQGIIDWARPLHRPWVPGPGVER